MKPGHITTSLATLAGILLATNPATAGVVFSESFEAPVVAGFDDNTVPNNGEWIGATLGFGASTRGLYNETFSWPATAAFTTPYGYQAYYLNYTNSGLTTSVGATGQTLTADVTYKVSFNAGVTAGTASGSYLLELVAFAPADDNAARTNCQGNRPGTILATATGTVSSNDMTATGSLTFTPGAANAHLGKDLGIRLIKSANNVLYDNIRLVTGHDMLPSPATGVHLPAGNTVLSWTNRPPNTPGGDVPVDVWFGTNPAALTQIVDGLLTSTTNVTAPSAGTYYWRVDSYPDGNPNGTPVTGDLFFFVVTDSDGDGLPDAYELANTTPSSATALDPASNLDSDGLTAAQEYYYGTNPNDNDTDNDTLIDGPELTGVGLRPATSPVDADSDDDGLSDGVETNTGNWVGAANTGTNPADADWDNDGIKDGGETNTAIYVDRFNTGSNPFLADTDSDGALDWYEANASFTNPNSNTQTPNVPYPLPDPVSSDLGAANKPVKVYIMAGQSNTVGIGQTNGTALGTLETITKRENKFPNLIDASNNWTKRNDVIYKGVVTATAAGPLTAGQGASSSQLGPELGFGQIMGWHHDEPVLILKASQGNRSLGWDFLPPGSTDWVVADKTYAGYGRSPAVSPTGIQTIFGSWYAGKQYDDCFRSPANTVTSPPGWLDATSYVKDATVLHKGFYWICTADHSSTPATEPDTGASWATRWRIYENAHTVLGTGVLRNLPTTGNNLNGRTYQIAGFCWWQGHKDHADNIYAPRYQQNLVQLINALRADFNAPNAPVVVATIGFGGGDVTTKLANYQLVHGAQMAVGNPALYPLFDGNVKSVDILKYWREVAESPTNQDYHYNQSAETYMLVGDAMGRAMLEMQDDTSPPSPDPMTFAIGPTAVVSGTIGMVATTATDFSGPVQYLFDETSGNPGATDSAWQTSPSYQDSGLTSGLTYTYRVKTRDALEIEGGWSAEITAIAGSDSTAPAPAPSFATPPAVQGETSISMAATTATDINGVEYYFDCTVGGGADSGWQSGTQFTATGLTPATPYTYVVRARDSIGNITTDSAPASATTLAPDTSPPSPATMSFATPPAALGTGAITMTAAAALDPSGVEYFFDETSGNSGGSDSGWQDSPTYTDSDLQPGTQYTYQVRARDKSPAQTANNFSPQASATTSLPDTTPPAVINYNPAPAAVDVAPSANLILTFNEEIVPGTGLITIKNLTDATETTIDITDGSQVSAAGAFLTINPAANLSNAKNYAIQIASTAVKDLNDNIFAGITNNTTWTFTSAVAPYIWTQTAGGAQAWAIGANWQGSLAPTPISGDTVDFSTVNITADTTLTLGADRAARLWKFGDTGLTQNWIVSAGNQIILAGTTPTIEVKQNTATLNNVVAGTSGLKKTGAGTVSLAGNNTYSGGTDVTAGTIIVGHANAFGSGLVTVSANSTVDVAYGLFPVIPNALHVGSAKTLTTTGSTQYFGMTFSGQLTGSGTIKTGGNGNNSNTGSKLGLTNSTNSFTGTLRNEGGSAIIAVNSLGDGGKIQLTANNADAGGFALNSGTATPLLFTTRQVELLGSSAIYNNNATASNTITINTNLAIGSTGDKTLSLRGGNTGNNTYGGIIANGNFSAATQVISLKKIDAGNWILTGVNTYTGKTTISAGTLSINLIGNVSGGSSALGNPSSVANGLILMGSENSTATLLYTGAGHSSDRAIQVNSSNNTNTGGAVIINNGSGALTFTSPTFNNTYTLGSVSTRTLTLGGIYSGSPNQIQGIIQDNSATGKVALTKANDASTWILGGSNPYTGTTTVSGGKLLINGNQSAASGSVSVAANATLGGTGTLGGNTTIAATGKLELNISTAAASHDRLELAATRTLTFSGASTLTITSSGGATPGTYTLLTAPGGIIGNVPATLILPANWVATVSKSGDNKDLLLNVTSTGVADPYATWSGGVAFDADANNDGIDNGMAWVLGAANPNSNSTSLLPTFDNTTDPVYFIFNYRRSDVANTAANITIAAQYGSSLSGWTNAVHDGTNIIITPSNDFHGAGIDSVQVKIKRTLAPGGKLFVRLMAVGP